MVIDLVIGTQYNITYREEKTFSIKGWNVIISKDRAQKGKRKAKAAAAIADEWNVKDRPYQALS